MRMVTINGEKVSPDREPEDWYYYRTDAFERLRKVASIDDLRALVEFSDFTPTQITSPLSRSTRLPSVDLFTHGKVATNEPPHSLTY